MKDKPDINLIHRYLTGECSSDEKKRVEDWINADPANRQAVNKLQKIWEIEPRKETEADLILAWQQLEEKLAESRGSISGADIRRHKIFSATKSRKKPGIKSTIFRIAAVFLLAFSLALFFIDFRSQTTETEELAEVVMKEVVAKRAHQTHITFSDGSKVILNSESRIRYPEKFEPGVREVQLEGEAYFDVTQSPGVEFIVQTSDATVKVLGTKFNVKDRPEEQEAEVVVSEGKVSVQSSTAADLNQNTDEVILTRGQISTIVRGKSPSAPQSVDLNDYLTWLQGGFVFHEETLASIFKSLERRFDVVFMIEDTALLSIRFSGEFKNEPVEEILRLASQSLDFEYERDGRIFTIKNSDNK